MKLLSLIGTTLALSLGLLTACGGGGESTSNGGGEGTSDVSNNENGTQQPLISNDLDTLPKIVNECTQKETDIIVGQLTTVIEGIHYSTDTLSGVTDSNGCFDFKQGESVSFYIGDVAIGQSAEAQSLLNLSLMFPNTKLFTEQQQLYRLLSMRSKQAPELIEFNKLHNALTFLYSVDQDKDPTNGVQINSALSALLANNDISFSGNWAEFRKNRHFIDTLKQAFSENLIASATVVKDGFGLDQLYLNESIEHNFSLISKKKYDNDANGSIDGTDTYTYNASGYKLSQSNDKELDGAENYGQRITYDKNNNRVTYDQYQHGTLSNSVSYVYDSEGNVVSKDLNSGDKFYYYTYDNYGNLLERAADNDGNGQIDEVRLYVYDSSSQLLTYSTDTENDGSVEFKLTFHYDEQGRLEKTITDYSHLAGEENGIQSYTYDMYNNVTSDTYDHLSDGDIDRVTAYSFDEKGNQLTQSFSQGSNDIPDLWTYFYDENNRKVSASFEPEGDGVITNIYRYSYDDESRLLTERKGTELHPIEHGFFAYEYNEKGQKTKESIDTDGDTKFDQISHFEWTYGSWESIISGYLFM